MSNLLIKTVITDAHHPRSLRGSTLNENDRLQVAYNVYTDRRFANSKVKGTHRQVNLAFMHGVGFSKDTWNYIIEKCFDNYGDRLGTVIALDAVNHCDSYVLNKGKLGWICTWEDYGRDLVKVLRDLDLKGGTIVVGHSMGGAAVLHAAALEKRLIDSVVTIEPVCFVDKAKYKGDPKVRKARVRLLEALGRSSAESFPNVEAFDKFYRFKNITKTFHPRVLDDVIKAHTVVDPETGVTTFKTPKHMQLVMYEASILSMWHIPELASTIDCEVCHIIGADSTWNSPETAPTLRSKLVYGTAVDIPKGLHLVPMEMPDETFQAMQAFIEKRIARIEELAIEDYGKNPNTPQEREDFYWTNAEKAKELFTSGKKILYSRL